MDDDAGKSPEELRREVDAIEAAAGARERRASRRVRENLIIVAGSFGLAAVLAIVWFFGYDLGLSRGLRTGCAIGAIAFGIAGVRSLIRTLIDAGASAMRR